MLSPNLPFKRMPFLIIGGMGLEGWEDGDALLTFMKLCEKDDDLSQKSASLCLSFDSDCTGESRRYTHEANGLGEGEWDCIADRAPHFQEKGLQ